MRRSTLVITAALAVVASGLAPVATSLASAATPSASTAAPKITTRLAAVTNLQVAPSSSGERLRWTSPAGSTLVGLTVRRAAGRVAPASPTGGTGIANLAPGTTSMVDSTVEPHAVYSYSVFAMYAGGKHASGASRPAKTASTMVEPAVSGAGTFSGTVTDAAGHPLKGVEVSATLAPATIDASGGFFFYLKRSHVARTAADGSFTINGITTRSYLICYTASTQNVTGGDSDTLGYEDDCPQDAVLGHSGQSNALGTTKLDANSGGVITGVVVDARTHVPVRGVQVEPLTQSSFTFVTSNSNGAFKIGMAAGSYVLCFDAEAATSATDATGYVSQCQDSAPVTVTPGEVTSVQIPLAEGDVITGVVKSTADGSPAANVFVDAQQRNGGFAQTITAADGSYRLSGLTDERVPVCADGFFTAFLGGGTGFAHACISVKPLHHSTVAAPDISVDPAGGVSGTVTTADGHPLSNVSINVTGRRVGYGTLTNPDGTYSFAGIPAGTYSVCFQAPAYPAQCYENRTPAQRPTPVTIAAGAFTPNIDGKLVGNAPGTIRLTVQDSHGNHLVGTDAVAVHRCADPQFGCQPAPVFAKPDNAVAGNALTGGGGVAMIGGLAPGHYAVCAFGRYATGGTSTTRYQDACSDVTYSLAVTKGATTSVTITLADGAAVSGTVTDRDGHPIPGVAVVTGDPKLGPTFGDEPTLTGPDGSYRIEGLPGGTIFACFDASSVIGRSPTGYASECYRNAFLRPTRITVTNGVVTTGIDAQLKPGGEISGTVTGAGGVPLAGVDVDIEGPSFGAFATTGPDGTYSVIGLTPGDYQVCFFSDSVVDAPPTGYVTECYQDSTFNPPTLVSVRAGQVVMGIDQELAVGAEISGSVTSGGEPVGDFVAILLVRTPAGLAGIGGEFVGGSYDFTALPAAKYLLCVDGGPSGLGAQCFNGVTWKGLGHAIPAGLTKIAVNPGDVVTVANMDIPATPA